MEVVRTQASPVPALRVDTQILVEGSAAVFDLAPIGQMFTDGTGRIVAANPHLARMLGYRPEELRGRMVWDLIAPDDLPAATMYREIVTEGARRRIDVVLHYRHRAGHTLPARLVATLIPGDAGRPLWASMILDLSEQEQTSVRLARAHQSASAQIEKLRLMHAVAGLANKASALSEFAPQMLDIVCRRNNWTAGALLQMDGPGRITLLYTDGPHQMFRGIDAAPFDLGAATAAFAADGHRIAVTPVPASTGDGRLLLAFAAVDIDIDDCRDVLEIVADETARLVEREAVNLARRSDMARLRTVFDASPLPMAIIVAGTHTYTAVNDALCALVRRRRGDLVGASTYGIIHPDDVGVADLDAVAAARAPGRRFDANLRLIRADGAVIDTETTLVRATSEDGTELLIAQIRDVTERRETERLLRRQARTDHLTGLLNRHGLEAELRGHQGAGDRLVMLLIDLDGFKHVNDTLGHAAGDQVLTEVAARLTRSARSGDTVARIGGDEFVVICPHRAAGPMPESGLCPVAATLADRIMDTMATAFTTDAGPIRLTASIGIAADGADTGALDLLRRADIAVYRAKALGRNQIAVYDRKLHQRTVERRRIEDTLHGALGEGRFVAHYQPIVDIDDGHVVGFEALMRLIDRDGTLIPPDRFIPIAEQSGQIVAAGTWILTQATTEIARLDARSEERPWVSVNVSARQAARNDLYETVQRALSASGLAPERLVLELTESTLLRAREGTLRQLTKLRGENIRIALDDFGTGYSSLTYLRQFPVSAIKIDQSFVANCTTSSQDAGIVDAVINLADNLGLDWIAEGIETGEQWRALRDLGYPRGHGQGYLFAKPLTADRLPGVVHGRPTTPH